MFVIFNFSGVGFLGVCVKWKNSDSLYYIVNGHSPCNLSGKRKMWEDLYMSKRGFEKGEWCVAGDFNAVVSKSERRGLSTQDNQQEIDEFRLFIDKKELVDVPLKGEKIYMV